jgi:hypothetical protein
MDTLTTSDLYELASLADGRSVSLFMPTFASGREGQQDAVRLKNLIVTAEEQLIKRGVRGTSAREFLKPIAELPHQPAWERRKQGLAVFHSEGTSRIYWLSTPLDEAVLVGRRFYLKRLLPAMGDNPQFYVLALSRDQVRLLKATWAGVARLEVPDLPTNMELALNLQASDRGEQVHSGMRGDLGKEAAVFHGQGGRGETLKSDIVTYFRTIDRAVGSVVKKYSLPLVLAGVKYELSLFRDVCRYDNVAEESLSGCFDHVSDHELYEQALPVAQRLNGNVRTAAIAKYRQLVGSERASNAVEQIVPAAHAGRIETLLVDPRGAIPGRFDEAMNSIDFITEREPEYDLVESCVAQTLLHRGTVYPVGREELPSSRWLRAIFRY